MDPEKIGALHEHKWFGPWQGQMLKCRKCDLMIRPEDQKLWEKLYQLFTKCEKWRAEKCDEEMLRLRDRLTDRLSDILPRTPFYKLRDYQSLQETPAYYRIDDYELSIMVRQNGVHDGWAALLVSIQFRMIFGASKWEYTHVFGDDLGKERFEVRQEPSIHDMKYNLPFDHVVRRREREKQAGSGWQYADTSR